MARRHTHVSDRLPTLRTVGVAVEYFPRYINRQLRPHSVEGVLLSYIAGGTCWHVMGRQRHAEQAGALGITHYGQDHDILTSPDGVSVFNIHLDLQEHALPTLPAELRVILPSILPLHPALQNRLNRRVRLNLPRQEWVFSLLNAMAIETRERGAGHEEALRSGLRLLLIECCRAAINTHPEISCPRASPQVPWLESLRQDLDLHYARTWSLAKVSVRYRVTKSHLCRAFRAYTGKSFMEYLTARRIQAAMLALRTSDEKILTIALDAGFSDASYFNRCFRKMVKTTPRMYRDTPGIVRAEKAQESAKRKRAISDSEKK